MKKTSKLSLQRNAIRILDRSEATRAAGGRRNPFDDTVHSHWVVCDTHFESVCFTYTDVLTAP